MYINTISSMVKPPGCLFPAFYLNIWGQHGSSLFFSVVYKFFKFRGKVKQMVNDYELFTSFLKIAAGPYKSESGSHQICFGKKHVNNW